MMLHKQGLECLNEHLSSLDTSPGYGRTGVGWIGSWPPCKCDDGMVIVIHSRR